MVFSSCDLRMLNLPRGRFALALTVFESVLKRMTVTFGYSFRTE
jgi:hypothetical protein